MIVTLSYLLEPHYFSSSLETIGQTFPEHVSRNCLHGWTGVSEFLGVSAWSSRVSESGSTEIKYSR